MITHMTLGHLSRSISAIRFGILEADEVHEDHGSGDHQKDIPVDYGRKIRRGRTSRDEEDRVGAQCIVRAGIWAW